ncbi:hypothetical protein ZWY2020_057621 [Hordeum vulgare]|nr:hypothetical protein ZWY2020_057621 [Hordeum vulgare]
MAAVEDDSCRRAGSIPFKWEVCPGTPKEHEERERRGAASPARWRKLTLTPPPSMASSPSPYYHHSTASSPRVTSARSASVSPSGAGPTRMPAVTAERRPPPSSTPSLGQQRSLNPIRRRLGASLCLSSGGKAARKAQASGPRPASAQLQLVGRQLQVGRRQAGDAAVCIDLISLVVATAAREVRRRSEGGVDAATRGWYF